MSHGKALMTVVRSDPAVAWRPGSVDWVRAYRVRAMLCDFGGAGAGAALAFLTRFGDLTPYVMPYLVMSALLPLVWVGAVALNRAYEPRMLGIGSEEFRRVVQCGVALTAAMAIGSYLTKTDVARGYVVLALPFVTLLTLSFRYGLRRALHRRRARGACLRRVVAVGHRASIDELVQRFRREPYHGMEVVAACLPEDAPGQSV
ncbi:MAG: sugar transferase, partial [Nonomuraea sp.]|nr:sugar transferase [Nonomuraea sp.]